MSLPGLETLSNEAASLPVQGSRRRQADDHLRLTELNRAAVVDHADDDSAPVSLATFGTVRETCPKCLHTHLYLVLRQRSVRTAHLFCAECAGCFDAHYASGANALTI
jgi:DNA-directed RNA polymerase subunit M/transcription elongation factor TFIIS